MTAVLLEEKDWPDTFAAPLLELVDPSSVRMVAVKKDGQIVAEMAVLRLTHFEGVRIHPDHRNAGVVRALLEKAHEAAREWPESWVLAGAADDKMRAICETLGGKRVEMDSYLVPLGEV